MQRISITIYCDVPNATPEDFDRLESRLGDPEILWNVLQDLECDGIVEEATAEVEYPHN